MTDASPDALVALIVEALNNQTTRGSVIRVFQRQVSEIALDTDDHEAWGVLHDLAYDLDFYEPDASKRQEDSSYFGDEQAEAIIREALRSLRQ